PRAPGRSLRGKSWQCPPDVGRHTARVPADVDDGAVLEDLPDGVRLLEEAVLHVHLLLAGHPGEGHMQFRDAVAREGCQLLRIDQILVGMAAPEEQERAADALTLGAKRRALLQKSAKRSEPGARDRKSVV